ncbi:MAG: hypothetical protein ACTSQP_16550 [Promethearchaeota archaeon]
MVNNIKYFKRFPVKANLTTIFLKMLENNYIEEIRKDLISCLRCFLLHISNKNTEAHEFYPKYIDLIKKSIEKLNQDFNLEILLEVCNLLKFKRIFPLLELSEKLKELNVALFGKIDNIVRSYEKWKINRRKLDRISKKYKLNLIKNTIESIFRKGIVQSDDKAYPSIIYHKRGRTIYKYIYDVSIGWLHEDIIKIWFKQILCNMENIELISIQQNAHDSNRVFKFSTKSQIISGEPDYTIRIRKNRTIIEFKLEIQHVSDKSRKKTKDLIEIPRHRISESKNYHNYILIIPYIDNNDKMQSICIKMGPLRCYEKNGKYYIEGVFFTPKKSIEIIKEIINSL